MFNNETKVSECPKTHFPSLYVCIYACNIAHTPTHGTQRRRIHINLVQGVCLKTRERQTEFSIRSTSDEERGPERTITPVWGHGVGPHGKLGAGSFGEEKESVSSSVAVDATEQC